MCQGGSRCSAYERPEVTPTVLWYSPFYARSAGGQHLVVQRPSGTASRAFADHGFAGVLCPGRGGRPDAGVGPRPHGVVPHPERHRLDGEHPELRE